MMTLLSVGLPALALAVLIPLYLVWETLLNHHPALETLLLKAIAFNPFELL